MNQKTQQIDVLSSIKRINIANNVFGDKSRKKLQIILDQKDIRRLFEIIPNQLMNEIKEKELEEFFTKYSEEYIAQKIMDNIIANILHEAVSEAIKINIYQLTDELVESVIDTQIVWLTIGSTQKEVERLIKLSKIDNIG